jgi:hypothetical protein
MFQYAVTDFGECMLKALNDDVRQRECKLSFTDGTGFWVWSNIRDQLG